MSTPPSTDLSRLQLPPSEKFFSPREMDLLAAFLRLGKAADEAAAKAKRQQERYEKIKKEVLAMPSWRLWDRACSEEVMRWSEARQSRS